MTTEEAIDILNNTAWLGSDNGIRVYPAVKMAAMALENQSKYKWHDLRKDPTDLPKINEKVIVCFEWESKYSDDTYRGYTVSYRHGNTFDGFGGMAGGVSKVIAWKEIEPFGEGEENE